MTDTGPSKLPATSGRCTSVSSHSVDSGPVLAADDQSAWLGRLFATRCCCSQQQNRLPYRGRLRELVRGAHLRQVRPAASEALECPDPQHLQRQFARGGLGFLGALHSKRRLCHSGVEDIKASLHALKPVVPLIRRKCRGR